jgi:peptidoglycan hydrolase-like protein with peptidoglycan-binding domain
LLLSIIANVDSLVLDNLSLKLMFPYKDPTGTDRLQRQGALTAYQGKLQAQFSDVAKTSDTKFVLLEKFNQLKPGIQADQKVVPWIAFPKLRSNLSNSEVDKARGDHEEYVEWATQSSGGRVDRITFTTEFPNYFQSLADISFDALVAGIKDVIPTANPTVKELLGLDQAPPRLKADGIVGPNTWRVLSQVLDRPFSNTSVLQLGSRGQEVEFLQVRLIWLGLLDGTVSGTFDEKTKAAVIAAQQKFSPAGAAFRNHLTANPWNNGSKGIFCMAHSANTIPALFGLMSPCAVPRRDRPEEVCGTLGGSCVPGRNSDPFVCSATQNLAKGGNLISLRDPVGIEIFKLLGEWKINGTRIEDINDPQKNQGVWQVTRGKRRGVLNNVAGLTLDGSPITSGAQVAKRLQVGAGIVVAAASDFQ